MGTLYMSSDLPISDPLEAAAEFYRMEASAIEALLSDPEHPEDELLIVFRPASYDHRGWRLAVIQDLARKYAPVRVNGIVSTGGEAMAEASRYLATAPGITGQLLEVACG